MQAFVSNVCLQYERLGHSIRAAQRQSQEWTTWQTQRRSKCRGHKSIPTCSLGDLGRKAFEEAASGKAQQGGSLMQFINMLRSHKQEILSLVNLPQEEENQRLKSLLLEIFQVNPTQLQPAGHPDLMVGEWKFAGSFSCASPLIAWEALFSNQDANDQSNSKLVLKNLVMFLNDSTEGICYELLFSIPDNCKLDGVLNKTGRDTFRVSLNSHPNKQGKWFVRYLDQDFLVFSTSAPTTDFTENVFVFSKKKN